MKMRTVGWVVGSLGLLFGAGTARAQEAQHEETSTGTAANQAAQQPVCRDAGVTVSFPTASYELDQNAIGALNGVATWMKADASRTLHLHGYADTTGNSESNLVLSEHRAQAVKDYLVSQGIDTSRIMTAGRGEDVGRGTARRWSHGDVPGLPGGRAGTGGRGDPSGSHRGGSAASSGARALSGGRCDAAALG